MILGLDKFGKVEQCERIGNEYHIKITDGFNSQAINTMDCISLISDAIPDFPVVSKMRTDKNDFLLILRK